MRDSVLDDCCMCNNISVLAVCLRHIIFLLRLSFNFVVEYLRIFSYPYPRSNHHIILEVNLFELTSKKIGKVKLHFSRLSCKITLQGVE